MGTWRMETLTTTAVQFPFRFLIPIPVLPKEVFVSNCNETCNEIDCCKNKQTKKYNKTSTRVFHRALC